MTNEQAEKEMHRMADYLSRYFGEPRFFFVQMNDVRILYSLN